MRAVLLAAGTGSRLRPITDTVPKCLVAIHGRPLIDYWFDLLFATGAIERALVNTHHLADHVYEHVAGSPWRDCIDLVYEETLLGTGGTIKRNRAYFGNASFLVAHADNLTDFDLDGLLVAHASRPSHCAITMLTFRTDDPRSCGVVVLDDRQVVTAFHEKVDEPPGNLANAAVYVFSPEVLDTLAQLPPEAVDLSTEVIPRFVGHILAVENRGYHRDIGNHESLRRAHLEFPRPTAHVGEATGGATDRQA